MMGRAARWLQLYSIHSLPLLRNFCRCCIGIPIPSSIAASMESHLCVVPASFSASLSARSFFFLWKRLRSTACWNLVLPKEVLFSDNSHRPQRCGFPLYSESLWKFGERDVDILLYFENKMLRFPIIVMMKLETTCKFGERGIIIPQLLAPYRL